MLGNTKKVNVEAIADVLGRHGVAHDVDGPSNEAAGVAPLNNCAPGDLVWSGSLAVDPEALPASIFLLPRGRASSRPEAGAKTLIFVDDPRNVFRLLLSEIFADRVAAATGLMDSKIFAEPRHGHGVRIADSVRMGKHVILHPNVILYPNVVIGNNVEIGAGTIIGAPGYGYVRQRDGTLEHFPHVGGVVIGNDVTIGANSCIDSGGLGPTRIGRGTKIGNMCQIAHNVDLGSDCLLAGRVQVGGGTKVGERTEIWPSSTLSHKLEIGSGCNIKIGSVVVQSLRDGANVSGNFAISHEKTLRDFAKKRR